MKRTLSLLCFIILFISCKSGLEERTNALDFVQANTTYALRITNLEEALSELNDNNLASRIFRTDKTKSLLDLIPFMDYLNTDEEMVIAFNAMDSTLLSNYYFVGKLKDSLNVQDSITPLNDSDLKFEPNTITEKEFNDKTLYCVLVDEFMVASQDKNRIEKTIAGSPKTKSLGLFKNLDSNASLTLYTLSEESLKDSLVNTEELKFVKPVTSFEFDLSKGHFALNGLLKSNDSLTSIISELHYPEAKEINVPNIIPQGSSSFVSYSINDSYTEKAIDTLSEFTVSQELKNLITEIGIFRMDNEKVIAVRSLDVDAMFENILSTPVETFRQVPIAELDPEFNLNNWIHPLSDETSNRLIMILEDFLIFPESVETAKSIISSYTNKATLGNSYNYENIKEGISDESSVLYYATASKLDSVVADNLPKALATNIDGLDLKKDHAQLIQVINDVGFSHVNMLVKEIRSKAQRNSISEMFAVNLGTELLNDPQVVKNYITGQKDIVVQDIENNLYLISNQGKIRWKKKINGNILGKVEQIDIYKNGRLQLAFATPNAIHIIDRKGNSVSPFPKKFNDEITQPLSVFDYDNNRNYRFMVVQGKNVLMYDNKGKSVRGFNFRSAASAVKTQPKHFRIGSRDYIVFGAGNKLHILNRKGQTRINVKDNIDFSDNEIYLYRNLFTTTNTKGQLVQVDQKGGVNQQNLLLPKDHYVSTTSKTLTTLAENDLKIKSNKFELDFGEYTAPKIFYLRDKIYVSVTDLQSQKVYLFDSNAKLLPNFPVFGNSSIELANFDRDRNLEFVVQGESKGLVLYQMN